jgi:hypothetical protein
MESIFMNYPAVIALTVLMSGCAYQKTTLLPPQSSTPLHVSGLCVMTAVDGSYNGKPYIGSGREVSNQVLAAMRSKALDSIIVNATDKQEATKQCSAQGANHLVIPSILHWEDRATNWSGLRDLIRIELQVTQIDPPKLLKVGTFEARNSWFTFVNNPPEDLLDEKFSKFVTETVWR